MKKILIMIFLLMLVGCNQSPKENLRDCIQQCDILESSEIFAEYANVVALENDMDIDISGFAREGYVYSNASPDITAINLVYSNEGTNYIDAFDLIDDLHPIYNLFANDLLSMETEKLLIINIGIAIEEGHNDYIFRFSIDESSSVDQLYVELDGFIDDYDTFIENVLNNLDVIFTYNDDFSIFVKLVTDHGYIDLESETDAQVIMLDIKPSTDYGASEDFQSDLKDAIDTALDHQYDIVIET